MSTKNMCMKYTKYRFMTDTTDFQLLFIPPFPPRSNRFGREVRRNDGHSFTSQEAGFSSRRWIFRVPGMAVISLS